MVLREALWDWFLDIRGSVMTAILPHFMLRKARQLAGQRLAEMAKLGKFVKMPMIDARWFRRPLTHYRIVLRHHKRRYKVSRDLGDARCVAEWTTVTKSGDLPNISSMTTWSKNGTGGREAFPYE